MSYTYAIMEVSKAVYDEIRAKLVETDYEHAINDHDSGECLDMHGIALRVESEEQPPAPNPDCEWCQKGIRLAKGPSGEWAHPLHRGWGICTSHKLPSRTDEEEARA